MVCETAVVCVGGAARGATTTRAAVRARHASEAWLAEVAYAVAPRGAVVRPLSGAAPAARAVTAHDALPAVCFNRHAGLFR